MKRLFALVAATTLFAVAASAQAPKPAPAAPGAPPAAPGAPVQDLNNDEMMIRLFSEAVSAFNQTKYDVALQQINAIHEKTNNKEYPKLMFLEGACLYNLDQFEKAGEVLGKFVKSFPDDEQVPQAKLNEGRALLKSPKAEQGVQVLESLAGDAKILAKNPEMKLQAGIDLANYYKKTEKLDEALKILVSITDGGPTSQDVIMAIIMKAEIYLAKSETEKAQAALEELRAGAAADESVVQINEVSRKIALDMMERKNWREALVTLQNVRRKSEILRIQNMRVARIQEWLKDVDKKPVFMQGRRLSKEEMEGMLTSNKTVLDEIEKAKDYDASVYYLLGQCFYEMQRYYESFVAFKRVYDEFKDYPDRSRALFGMIVNTAALKQSSRSVKYCESYITEFPEGANVTQVTDMYGTLVYQSGDVEGAIRAFRKAKEAKNADKERLSFMLGSMLFEVQRFEDSRMEFQALLKEFKGSAFKDDAEYRVALTWFFENKSVEAKRSFKDYIANNPHGQYLVDAKYRMAFITYQGANTGQGGGTVQEALDVLERLTQESPSDPGIGQVYALLGDIYNSNNNKQTDDTKGVNYAAKAAEAYKAGFDKATSEDVQSYCIDNLTGLLTADNKWAEVSSVWSTYHSTHPDGPLALKAIYWISKAKQREEHELESKHQYPEAAEKRLEAEKLIAGAILPHLANPAKEQVEMLITQLVSMMTPKKKSFRKAQAPAAPPAETPAAPPTAADPDPAKAAQGKPAEAPKPAEGDKPAADKPAEVAPAPVVAAAPPPPTFDQAEELLKKLLTPEGDQNVTNGTAAARVLYARALLARVYRDLSKYENLISVIPDAAKAEELSPLLLATLAEMLMKKGDTDKAGPYFARLREAYPNSDYADHAPVGLGDIEFIKGNYDEALKLYDEGINKGSGTTAMLDATLGKGKTLYKLKRYDPAEKVFRTVVQIKDWKSAAGQGYFYLGLIAEAQKKWELALSYYKRVILAHQHDKDYLAKSYLQAAKCLLNTDYKPPTTDKDGKPLPESSIPDPKKEADQYLQEMLRKKGMETLPEFKSAQDLLAKISS